MLRILVITAFLSFSLIGCTESDNEIDVDQPSEKPDQAHEAYEAVEEDIKVKRKEFINNLQEEIKNIENDLSKVRLQIEEETGEQQAKLKKTWEELTKEKNSLKDEIKNLEERSIDNWHQRRADLDSRLDSLKMVFNNLKENLDES